MKKVSEEDEQKQANFMENLLALCYLDFIAKLATGQFEKEDRKDGRKISHKQRPRDD